MEGDLIRINEWLSPLSWLYAIGVETRNALFDMGILPSRSYDIPIINIGNITVGGTGKTPHVEYLVQLLSRDYKVAVLSRGYKRRSKGYVLATPESRVEDIGDESWQMKHKFPNIYVAVDANRRRGIERLMHDDATRDVEVILLDDAFQHRYVKPGMNILLVDYHRMITDDRLLPAGRLRENVSAKRRANMVIVSKCPHDITPMGFRVIQSALQLQPFQQLYFSTLRYSDLRQMAGSKAERLKRIGITMMESAEADASPSDGDGQAHTGRGIRRQPTTTHLPFIGGGTSAKKMMTQMFDLLDNDGLHYVNADVLWITDFLIPDPPQQLLSRFREYKETGTRFYGIRIVRDDDKEPNSWKEYFNQIYSIRYRPLRRY